MMLEMTMPNPWVDLTFDLMEGWWLFGDRRRHAVAPPSLWDKRSWLVGYGHVDWTEGNIPETEIQRIISALVSEARYSLPPPASPALLSSIFTPNPADTEKRRNAVDLHVDEYTRDTVLDLPAHNEETDALEVSTGAMTVVPVTGGTGSLGSHIVAHLCVMPFLDEVVCLNRRSRATDPTIRQQETLRSRDIFLPPEALSKL